MSNNNRRVRGKAPRKGRKTRRNKNTLGTVDPAPFIAGRTQRIGRNPVPDSVLVSLYYQDTQVVRNNAGFFFTSWRYKMNSAFDPDPLIGSGSLSGFNEWATMYTTYRVIGFSYQISIANMDSFPYLVVICPSLTDVGSNYANTDQLSEFPYGRKSLISAKGGMDKCSLNGLVNLPALEGSATYYQSNEFASLISTNPSTIRYFNIGASAPVVMVNGVFISVRLKYEVLFYRRTNIFS
jgi:hypothetical protein